MLDILITSGRKIVNDRNFVSFADEVCRRDADPTKPAPPVIKIFINFYFNFRFYFINDSLNYCACVLFSDTMYFQLLSRKIATVFFKPSAKTESSAASRVDSFARVRYSAGAVSGRPAAGQIFDFDFFADGFADFLRQFIHRKFARIADIDGQMNVFRFGIHQTNNAFDQIINVTERTRLFAVAVNRQIFAAQVPER